MAGEIQASLRAGLQYYAQVRSRTSTIWAASGTGAFESYQSANIAMYAITCTEQGTASAYYVGTFPSAIPAGIYSLLIKQQIGGSPSESDPTVATGDVNWNGTAIAPLSDAATSGQLGQAIPIKIARGVQITNFPFRLVSSVDHVTPFTSGTVSGQIARDGGSFGALQSGAFVERGLGWYDTTLTSGDLNGGTVRLNFSAVGISGGTADSLGFAMILQKSSGSV